MKIIYNNIIPFKGYCAMNLFGTIFARKDYGQLSDAILNHEAIHTAQMKELLYVPFYILYCAEYIINIFKYWNLDKAYRNISFEKEAYANEKDLNYLKTRHKFAEYK